MNAQTFFKLSLGALFLAGTLFIGKVVFFSDGNVNIPNPFASSDVVVTDSARDARLQVIATYATGIEGMVTNLKAEIAKLQEQGSSPEALRRLVALKGRLAELETNVAGVATEVTGTKGELEAIYNLMLTPTATPPADPPDAS